LARSGISLDGNKPRFSYIHLDGPHPPTYMDRDAQPVPQGSVSEVEQARGAYKIVFDFIDELKRLGVYKDASIVITADHGIQAPNGDPQPLVAPRLTSLFVKPAGVEGAPMAHSVAPVDMANVRATLLADAGEPDGTPTVFSVDPGSTAPRDFYLRSGWNTVQGKIRHWRVTGDARDWSNWRFIGEEGTKYWG
jgi:arylsulfatase A-like enzyme